MPRKSPLTPKQLHAARFEYEVTPISGRHLAAKYDISRTTLQDLIQREGWVKGKDLQTYEGRDGHKRFERDLRAAVKATFNTKVIKGLQRNVAGSEGHKPAIAPAIPATPPDPAPACEAATGSPGDQPHSLKNAATPAAGATPQKPPQRGEVVPFPGAGLPPLPEKPATSFGLPSRVKTEAAAQRMRLAELRGEVTMQQITELTDTGDVLKDVEHIFSIYLTPAKYTDVAGLNEEAAAAKIEQTQRAAGRLLMPTERDTFAGVLTAFHRAKLNNFAAIRVAAGIAPGKSGLPSEPDEATATDFTVHSIEELQRAQALMELFNGHAQTVTEPPKPPPPQTLDDIMAKPDTPPP